MTQPPTPIEAKDHPKTHGVALNKKASPNKSLRHRAWDLYRQATDLVTGRERTLPAFIIGGGMRCGTTALFSYLAHHPELSVSRKKEVHYFDLHHHRGLNWYKRQFHATQKSPEGKPKLLFESSPYYMFEPRAPKRIKDALPNIKLIFLLRDPIERAISQYQKDIRDGRELLPLAAAWAAEEHRLEGEEDKLLSDPNYHSQLHQHFSYKARGRYSKLLHRYYQYFPKEQILTIHSNSLFSKPIEVLHHICAFIGIQQWSPDHFPVINQSQIKANLDSALRLQLEHEFEPYEQELEQLVGWRSADWPRRAS
jgi:hypothetical protein